MAFLLSSEAVGASWMRRRKLSAPRSVPWGRVIAMTAVLLGHGCTCGPPAKESVERRDAQSQPVGAPLGARGMWVWKTRARLPDPAFKTSLLETCQKAKLNEIYLSVSTGVLEDPRLPELMTALRGQGVRVEALMGEAVWYKRDKRGAMHSMIEAVAAYNDAHRADPFAGVHLDIEPHQLAENRGGHTFLPDLAETLKEASDTARKRNLGLSADLPRFALEEQGPAFARAVARPFVMLYELRDRSSERLVSVSANVVERVYAGLGPEVSGVLVVGLSADDYPADLEAMLAALDAAHAKGARYGGWAIHDEAKYRARPGR
jgi:hypothetical protein